MSDWSYYYGMPRSQAHLERYGTTDVPPRQFRFARARIGAGRAGLETGAGDLIVIGLILLGLYVFTKKR